MLYMLCKHKVEDFDIWNKVFQSHTEAHQETGLHLLHLLRDTADQDNVVMLFRIDDLDKAKAFTEAPEAHEAAKESGVLGVPEVLILND